MISFANRLHQTTVSLLEHGFLHIHHVGVFLCDRAKNVGNFFGIALLKRLKKASVCTPHLSHNILFGERGLPLRQTL